MAQFGGNKNPPWAQGGRAGPPGGGPPAGGAIDVPGLVGAFGAAAAAGQAGPPVFHQGGGIPPGLGVGHLGVPGGHGPAVTLAAMASQPVSFLRDFFFRIQQISVPLRDRGPPLHTYSPLMNYSNAHLLISQGW